MDPSQNPNVFHATTILSVRRDGRVAVAGDGQVTLGHTVMKGNARKVRRLGRDGQVLAGFAGAAADAFTSLGLSRRQALTSAWWPMSQMPMTRGRCCRARAGHASAGADRRETRGRACRSAARASASFLRSMGERHVRPDGSMVFLVEALTGLCEHPP